MRLWQNQRGHCRFGGCWWYVIKRSNDQLENLDAESTAFKAKNQWYIVLIIKCSYTFVSSFNEKSYKAEGRSCILLEKKYIMSCHWTFTALKKIKKKKEHISIYYLPTQIRNFRIIPKLVFKFHISKLAF